MAKKKKDDTTGHDNDAAITRDIRSGQKFTLAGAIGRKGGSLLKGGQVVPELTRAVTAINSFIMENLADSSGALRSVLIAIVKDDIETVSAHVETPLKALEVILDRYSSNAHLLEDLVRRVDFTWGRMNLEKPHFQKEGEAPHPDDEYTVDSVKQQLEGLALLLRKKSRGRTRFQK